jgi:sugar phosphate isomerase/epimerase
MKKALHTKTVYGCNLATALSVAESTGFSAVEIVAERLYSYLHQGNTPGDLKKLLVGHGLEAVCINDICHVDREDDAAKDKMDEEAWMLSSVAKEIGCKAIQLVPLCSLEGRNWKDVRRITADNIRRIADIGSKFGVGFQLEPVAWSPIHSLSKSLDLINAVDRDNLRMVVDFWHLWSGGETTPEEVSRLSKDQIYNIHFCDGKRQDRDTAWDETVLRGYYPGDGDIPLKEWVDAVKATGFDQHWSCELISSRHWEMNAIEVATTMSHAMDKYIGN